MGYPDPLERPVDVLWRIRATAVPGGYTLQHELTGLSPRLELQRVEGITSTWPAAQWQRRSSMFFERLEALLRRRAGDDRIARPEVFEELSAVGEDLWTRLVPAPVQHFFDRAGNGVRSLLLETDEPWIPWEMAVPDAASELPFLCCRYELARWLTQETGPRGTFSIRELLLIPGAAGAREDLPASRAEARWLHRWALERGLRVRSLGKARRAEVVQAIREGSFDLLHFTGHGDVDADDPDRAALVLGRERLRPTHLRRDVLQATSETRPLVLLNACRSGLQGHALTGLGGWPDRWLRRGGCGALICPQWQVGDSSAGRFSEHLYRALDSGSTLGAAVLEARRALLQAECWDPTPLAYCLYGHPNAVLRFGPPEPGRQTVEDSGARRSTGRSRSRPARIEVLLRHPPELSWSSIWKRRGLLLIVLLPVFWLGLRVIGTAREPVRWIELRAVDADLPGFESLRRTPIPLSTVARLVRRVTPLEPSVLGLDIELVEAPGTEDAGFQEFAASLRELPATVILAETPSLSRRLRSLCKHRPGPFACRLGRTDVSLDLLSFSTSLEPETPPFFLAVARRTRPPHWAARAVLPVAVRRPSLDGPLALRPLLSDGLAVESYRRLVAGRPLILGGFLDDRPVQLQDVHRPNIPPWHPDFGNRLSGVEIQARLAGHAEPGDGLLWLVDVHRLWIPLATLTLVAGFWRGSAGFWVSVLYLSAAVGARGFQNVLWPLWPVIPWALLDLWKRRTC